MWTRLVEQLAWLRKINNSIKRQDPMEWVGRTNTIRCQATEIVNRELINC